jgi:2-polyprenyl-3-methyl-5-hydroxy-6-metoxy-1,4-benzoquinol methylase
MGASTRQLGIAAAAGGQWGRSPRFHARGLATDRVDVTASPGAAFERIEPDTASWAAYFSNHIHRYMFAAEKLKEVGARHVLDAACGVGYGARYLADTAAVTVVAADRDAGALQIATDRFPHRAVTLVQDDCHTLAPCQPLGPFDAVVSFETVEHLQRPADFLKRCRKLLVARGLLIASTPNRGAEAAPLDWNYHEREYTAAELGLLLAEAGFGQMALYRQRLTALGEFRREVRAELNFLRFNPFFRAGQRLQRLVRGRTKPLPVLPEQIGDFETVPLENAQECDALGASGPFVLIALSRS